MTGGTHPAGAQRRPVVHSPPPDTAARRAGATLVPLRRRAAPTGSPAPWSRRWRRRSRAGSAAGAAARARPRRRAPAQPQPHRRPGSTCSPAPGFCSTTIWPPVASAGSGGPSGSALTATSRADARTRRAVSHSSPTTSGTTTTRPVERGRHQLGRRLLGGLAAARRPPPRSDGRRAVVEVAPPLPRRLPGDPQPRGDLRPALRPPPRGPHGGQLGLVEQPPQRADVRQRVERRVAVDRAPLVPAPQPLPRLEPVRPGHPPMAVRLP